MMVRRALALAAVGAGVVATVATSEFEGIPPNAPPVVVVGVDDDQPPLQALDDVSVDVAAGASVVVTGRADYAFDDAAVDADARMFLEVFRADGLGLPFDVVVGNDPETSQTVSSDGAFALELLVPLSCGGGAGCVHQESFAIGIDGAETGALDDVVVRALGTLDVPLGTEGATVRIELFDP